MLCVLPSLLYTGDAAVMATEENKVRATTATSGDGSAGRGEREGADTSLSPELVMELKKDFIFPVKDAQPQLLKDCRVCWVLVAYICMT